MPITKPIYVVTVDSEDIFCTYSFREAKERLCTAIDETCETLDPIGIHTDAASVKYEIGSNDVYTPRMAWTLLGIEHAIERE